MKHLLIWAAIVAMAVGCVAVVAGHTNVGLVSGGAFIQLVFAACVGSEV